MKKSSNLMGLFLIILSVFVLISGCIGAPPENVKQGCLQATIRGINLEIARYQGWIGGTVKADDLAALEVELKRLQADLQKYQAMKPADYQLPEAKVMEVWVEDTKPGENSILYFEAISRSGPWYHLTGIAGADYSILKPKQKQKVTVYKVYPRNYFNMESAYVYVSFSAPVAEDLSKRYQLEYQTYRVDAMKQLALTSLGGGKIQLVTDIIDGGCITKETLTIKAVETAGNNVTVLHLLYTLDGQPCKAFFTRELKATLRLPQPGAYRIKLWINELYKNQGEVLSGEKEITI
jgi:hypothetical protein